MRINVYEYGGHEADYEISRAGHFESSKATRWDDADYDGNGSGGTGRGQAVWHTSGGRWVLEHWSRWQDEKRGRYEYVEPDAAREWLLSNGDDAAVREHFGDIAEEEDGRGPGRPAIGEPVNVRLGDLRGPVDAYAQENSLSRAEAIRALVQRSLSAALRVEHDGRPVDAEEAR